MSKIELTITPDYVPTWTSVDAIRELFQNALDQDSNGSAASWGYDPETETFRISNAESKLTANTLLLGSTSKAGDNKTIGQFGEGYKIATLVLIRNNKNVVFHNYGAREVWRPRFVASRKFGANILTFFIDKKAIWDKVPDNDLTIEVQGITQEEWDELIVPSNLHLQEDYDIIESTMYGDVVSKPGKVYVNGLFVCDYEPYKYGYNFKPAHLKLDRDRKMVSDFDLRWVASKIWSTLENSDSITELIMTGAADVAYISNVGSLKNWAEPVAAKFIEEHGVTAVPVSTQSELANVPKGRVGVLVDEQYQKYVIRSTAYVVPVKEVPEETTLDTIAASIQDWLDSVNHRLDQEDVDRLDNLLDELRDAIKYEKEEKTI